MRLAVLGPSAIAIAVALFACSTFSGSSEEAPAPQPDGGVDTSVPSTCQPIVFDPSAASTCPGVDLQTSADNCGACGHRCVDSECSAGRCKVEKLTDELPPFAVDGTMLYHQVGADLHVRDLTKRPADATLFFPNLSGQVSRIEAYQGKLYISSSNDQTTLNLSDKLPAKNADFASVNTTVVNGLFYPGPTSYYLFADPGGGEQLAQIANGSVDYKRKPKFTPIARTGGDIFWTETLQAGANIYGPWNQEDEPIARVGNAVGPNAITAIAAETNTVYYATLGSVSRAARGEPVASLAKTNGVGVAFAIDGNDLYYAVRVDSTAGARYALHRVDKCRGGAPVPLFEDVFEIRDVFFIDSTHVMINTSGGLFRTRR